MTFNIRQRLFDKHGEYREKAAMRYMDALEEQFLTSPEGQALVEQGAGPGFWVHVFVDYGLSYLGVTPPEMEPHHVDELVTSILPRKVSTEECEDAIPELVAFWHFLKRQYQLPNADACIETLTELEEEFVAAMSDPSKWGMAKSFFMMGKARGFDMDTEESINAWMETYNAELLSGQGQPLPLPSVGGPFFPSLGAPSRRKRADKKKKRRRKMARRSRRKNR